MEIFIQNTTLLLITVGILGLIIGSFLNVVIYRLPLMMERAWLSPSAKILDPLNGIELTLAKPRSRCPKCKHTITALENIPIISYIFLGGKCSSCKTKISIRYPIIELSSAILAVITAKFFMLDIFALSMALLFTWALLCLSMIDIDKYILPDDITIPFLWLGLICNLFGLYTDIYSAVIGAILGYMILWSVYWIFKLLTGKEGMGYGDFKLLAMLCAWLGWQALPMILFLSSLMGAIVGLTLLFLKKQNKDTPIPFGPYLAGAGWFSMLYGQIYSYHDAINFISL
jgi:leader peptidase (prepilin peptidase)/N-methyltransferase